MNTVENLAPFVKELEIALEKKQVAQTIKSQIARNELWAIGAKNFISLSSTSFGGLQFDCSLFNAKRCKVLIILTGEDLYNVALYRGPKLISCGSAKGVYAEDLTAVVVDLVEKRFKM